MLAGASRSSLSRARMSSTSSTTSTSPWDGPNNRKLLDKMPPDLPTPGRGQEVFVLLHALEPSRAWATRPRGLMSSVTDGLSYTISLVEARRATSRGRSRRISPCPSPPMGRTSHFRSSAASSPTASTPCSADGRGYELSRIRTRPDTLKSILSAKMAARSFRRSEPTTDARRRPGRSGRLRRLQPEFATREGEGAEDEEDGRGDRQVEGGPVEARGELRGRCSSPPPPRGASGSPGRGIGT